VGAEVQKLSEVKSVDIKEGGSGTLGLVKVEHRVVQDETLCLVEEQDLVYREPSSKPQGEASAPAAPDVATHSKTIMPDEVTLFRFSALTYNAHRIHYDREYAMGVEGYPGLVVHGPFTASQLSLFATTIRAGERMSSFSFRGTSPLFDRTPFNIHAKPDGDDLSLWAERPTGGLAMKATASFE
jgi:3-methylfumaryl-CoA hydratase